jgi:dihydroflavonol-4-reductase
LVGDVTDPAAVDQAVRDCEAVVHAGSVFSFDSRDAGRIRQVNVRGADLVLGARIGLGWTRSCISPAWWRCCPRAARP